ncbi:MAG TPA: S8 family serine peptidase, partial [Acidimicrobiales bacterium]|nr:S8 family serine peptidase [Acidimicrobiales bacterium]
DGAEAFGDVSSIAAQGNAVYNVSHYVNRNVAKVLPSRGCYVKIVGAAPGASVYALKVIGNGGGGSVSSIVQAVQYAVAHGAKVINESFGGEQFPDTSLDVVRAADDAAVAAGVTVVASSGDSGPTSTIGSPASDPNVISVGASTTFRAYAQTDLGGFYNPVVGNGHWLSGNISALSSSGYTQAGGAINLVAPGEVNWALCSVNYKFFTGCKDTFNGVDNGLQTFGGTSEAAPLTAAAAADVIQAYAASHGGSDPSPVLVKEILCSTATDIGAPAVEQGAGLLNVAGAVRLATSIPASVAATTTTTSPAPSATTSTTAPTTTSTPTTTSSPTTTSTTSVAAGGSATTPAGSRTGISAQPDRADVASLTRAARSPSGLAADIAPPFGDLLVSPSEIDVSGHAGSRVLEKVAITNTASAPVTLRLSTRALEQRIYNTGVREFQLDPATPTTNMGVFPIWSGVNEIYQTETFNVPTTGSSRLVFTADYQNSNQGSSLHVALYGPSGTYSAYSSPQGVGDFADAEVANPQPGKWTAFFFTAENGAQKGLTGTSGVVQWDASILGFRKAAPVAPAALTVAPGQTVQAELNVRIPLQAGDSDESLVIGSASGRTTVPVIIRSLVGLGVRGGQFAGVLTGGNGRPGSDAQTNTFVFDVPAGKRDLDVSVALATDPKDQLIGYLVAPDGQTIGYSSNYTFVPSGSSFAPKQIAQPVPGSTPYLQTYALDPQAGQWELVLQWANPVTGNELTEPFTGTVQFNKVKVTVPGLPTAGTRKLRQGHATRFSMHLVNTGVAPAAYFLDPRQDRVTTIQLSDLNPGSHGDTTSLPMSGASALPIYLVPPGTTSLKATVTELVGQGNISFDLSRVAGDPDISSVVSSPAVTVTGQGKSQTIQLSSAEVSPGLWALQPSQLGPYPPAGQPKALVASTLEAQTLAFDKSVGNPTDDLWANDLSSANFAYLEPGQSANLKISITPVGPVGSQVGGIIYVDEFALGSLSGTGGIWPDADVLAAVPFSYVVGAP